MATTQTTELQLFKPEVGGEEDTWGQLLNTNMDEIDAHAASVNTTLGTLGTAATEADTKYAHRANNLSDLQSASAARTSLGLGTAATEADTKYNHRANNLSDVTNQSTARNNLGLGTAAVQNDTRYNHRSNNLSDVANAATARVNLGAHNASNLTSGTVNAARLNILGTVSQSSGVPTGAIIERDSNDNGEYVKFADGTLICTGSGFSDGATTTFWDFPTAFSSSFIQVFGTGAGAAALSFVLITVTTSAVGWNLRDTNNQRAGDVSTRLMAIGRWY